MNLRKAAIARMKLKLPKYEDTVKVPETLKLRRKMVFGSVGTMQPKCPLIRSEKNVGPRD